MSLRYNLYRLKYKYGKYLPLRTPVDISLELTSQCNMRCNYCYHSDQANLPFTKGFMDTEVAYKIIEEAARAGVNSIKFNWKGESTLHPDYRAITKYANLYASGSTFIDRLANSNFKIPKSKREKVFEGLASLTKVKISYDSFRKEVFEHQRAGGNHDLTTENIDLFYNHPERIKSETKMVIQAVRTKLNADEDILHETKKRWPEADISIRDMVGGRVEKDLEEYENRERDNSKRQSCNQAHVRIIFAHDGKAYPCCPDVKEELCIGDIKTQSLKKIFNSDKAWLLRQQLMSGKAFDKDPCKSCSSFETFKGYKASWDS